MIAADGECPSVSPDGTRVAFKRRIVDGAQPVRWQLMTMSLATRAALALAESRSVDDQVEWLDDTHILYALPRAASGTAETDTWVVDADGGGAPKLVPSQRELRRRSRAREREPRMSRMRQCSIREIRG